MPALGRAHAHVRCPPSLALAEMPESWQAMALGLERLGKRGQLGTGCPLGIGLPSLARQPRSWDASKTLRSRYGELWQCALTALSRCDSPVEGAIYSCDRREWRGSRTQHVSSGCGEVVKPSKYT